jgi:Flp pilus assembly CpaF family ATPase
VKFAAAKLLTFYSSSRRGTAARSPRLTQTQRRKRFSRFTTCVLQSGVEMPYLAIKTNIADSLNVVVQIERRPGKRFLSEVSEIRGYDLFTDQYHFHQVAVALKDYS